MHRTILIFIISLFISHTIFDAIAYSGTDRRRGFGRPKGSIDTSKIPILIGGEIGKEIGIIVNRLRDNIPIEEVTFKVPYKKRKIKKIIRKPHFVVALDPDTSFNATSSISIQNEYAISSQLRINSGTLQFVKSPDELAFVIAHEIGHFVKGHLDAVVVSWMGNVTGNKGFNILANALVAVRFPWQMEYEADSAAVRYMYTAGYNIDDAIAIMKRLSGQYGDCRICSHPPSNERLAKIEDLVASLKYQNKNIKPDSSLISHETKQ